MKNIHSIFWEAVNGIDVKENLEIIISSNNPVYLYSAALRIKDLSPYTIEDFEYRILLQDNPHYIFEFAKNIQGANILKIQNKIIQINNIHYLYLFARDVDNADVNLIEDIIINSNRSVNEICNVCVSFAKDIKKSNKKKLFEYILNYGGKIWIDRFVNFVDMTGLEDYLLFI